MGVPGDEIFFLISTFFTDSENIYIDYKFNGPFLIEHPSLKNNLCLKLIKLKAIYEFQNTYSNQYQIILEEYFLNYKYLILQNNH
jgi:hypothetical protein